MLKSCWKLDKHETKIWLLTKFKASSFDSVVIISILNEFLIRFVLLIGLTAVALEKQTFYVYLFIVFKSSIK
jgi:hypothetical protein